MLYFLPSSGCCLETWFLLVALFTEPESKIINIRRKKIKIWVCFQFPSVAPKRALCQDFQWALCAWTSVEQAEAGEYCYRVVQEPSVGSGAVEIDPSLAVPSSMSLDKLQDFLPNLISSSNNYSSGCTLIFCRFGVEVCRCFSCLWWQHHPILLYLFLPFMEKSFSCNKLGLFPFLLLFLSPSSEAFQASLLKSSIN